MRLIFRFILIMLLSPGAASALFAQTITVSGEVTRPLTLSMTDLARFHPLEIKAKDREGREHTYSGVLLASVLDSAGVTMGAQLRGQNLMKYVAIRAADGYEVIFALAEIDPEFSAQQIILATLVDGHALLKEEGPFRIVAPQDKKPSRWIRQVVSIQVHFAKN